MTTGNKDIDIIASEPTPLALESGFPINVLRLKTRAMMSLLKVLTYGATDALMTLRFDQETTEEQFTGQLLGAVILAIPEAEDETIEFIKRMVEPGDLNHNPRTKADVESNNALLEVLDAELEDPELTDLLTIVSTIITNEAPHIRALGKQLTALIAIQRPKTPEASKPARKPRASSASASKSSTPITS